MRTRATRLISNPPPPSHNKNHEKEDEKVLTCFVENSAYYQNIYSCLPWILFSKTNEGLVKLKQWNLLLTNPHRP